MAIKDFYPVIRPTLDLNFAGSRVVDPRISFSRSGTGNVAGYFDEKGVMKFAPPNVPRIDFDPVTGECKGLLIEEQRTNLLTYSEQFDNVAWKKGGVTITANAAVSPDRTLTADKLVEDTVNQQHQLNQVSSIADNTTVCMSAYIKAGERARALVAITTKTGGFKCRLFNLLDGTNSQPTETGYTTGPAAYGMENVGNGYYRCWVADSVGSGGAVTEHGRVFIYNGAPSYTGDGTSGIYIWGAQLEAGSFPTSYIKTEASQVTRAADNASMLGENFSSWYRQDEGTFVVGWRRNYTFTGAEGGGTPRVFTINDDALTTLLNLSGNTSGGVSEVFGGSGTAANLFLTSTVVPANTPTTFACAYKENDCAMVRDGGGSAIDTSYIPATSFTRLYLGNRQSIDRPLNGHISRLAYYPRRLVNEQLQSLTV